MLASELGVLFRRRRTWAMLCALAAIPILIAVAVRVSSAVPAGRGPAFLDRISQNGLFVGVTAMLVSVPLFLPLTVGVVAGDTVAGEAGLGTLRYLLVAPAGRVRLLLVKYAGAVVFAVTAPLVVALVGAGIGAALFPSAGCWDGLRSVEQLQAIFIYPPASSVCRTWFSRRGLAIISLPRVGLAPRRFLVDCRLRDSSRS